MPLWLVIGMFVIRQATVGTIMMPAATWAMSTLDNCATADGTAILNTLRTIAGAIGSAMFVSLSSVVAESAGLIAGIDAAFIGITALAAAALLFGIIFVKTPVAPRGSNKRAVSKVSPPFCIHTTVSLNFRLSIENSVSSLDPGVFCHNAATRQADIFGRGTGLQHLVFAPQDRPERPEEGVSISLYRRGGESTPGILGQSYRALSQTDRHLLCSIKLIYERARASLYSFYQLPEVIRSTLYTARIHEGTRRDTGDV